MLKGQVFANQLFENQIFALFVNTFTNGKNGVSNNYKNGMAITYSGSDVTIDSGAVLIQGRFLEEDTSTTISAGADNMYCKLVVEIDLDKTNTTTEFNQGYYKIVKGANAYPTLTQTNIVKNVSGVYQYELARFRTTTSGITDFQDKRTFIDFDSIYDEIEQHIQDIDEGSLWVLKAGDTMSGQLVAEGGIVGNVQGNLQGNASTSTSAGTCTGNSATATKLATARTIALSGAVTGSISFDGSANKTMTTSLPSYDGTYISINSFDSTDGYFTLLFRRRGNVVQVEIYGYAYANHSTIMLSSAQTITIPDWAKTSMSSTDHMIPLIKAPWSGNNIVRSTAFMLGKMVNGTYRVGGLIERSDTGASTFYTTGVYIV